MMMRSGMQPLHSLYFLSAFITAGFMELSSSDWADSWRLAEDTNLVQESFSEATSAPQDLDLWRVS